MSGSPRVSIQIVTWNSGAAIDACLQSVAEQTCRDLEVIVVDNGSTDASRRQVAAWIPDRVAGRLLSEPTNRGFCAAQNRAFDASSGEFVLFLNPDAVLRVDFVAQAIAVADTRPADVGTIAPCILLPDGRIDSAGLRMDRLRRAYDRGQGEAVESFTVEEDVFGCTGAVALHRRTMLLDVAVGGRPLDENLFAYYDDLDLSWRARLRGWRCRYVPALRAVHYRAGRNALRGLGDRPTRSLEQPLTVRNRLLVMAKCDRAMSLLADAPWLLGFELARTAFLCLRAPAALRGYPQALAALPAALRARRQIQRRASAPAAVWR